MSSMAWFVYILECGDKSFYVGLTTSLERRVTQHQHGVFNNFTKSRRPVKLVYWEEFQDKHLAALREKQVKDYRREKKQILITKLASSESEKPR